MLSSLPAGSIGDNRTVRQLLAVIDAMQPEDSGRFLGGDGVGIRW